MLLSSYTHQSCLKIMVTIINGTHRPDNKSQLFSKACVALLQAQHPALEVNYLTLETLNTNHLQAEMFGQRTPQFQKLIDTYIAPAHTFVFVIPEYNGSYPGVLKLFIDSLSPQLFRGKKACVIGVSDGRAGAIMGIDHLTVTLNHIGVTTLPQRQPFANISTLITDNALTNKETLATLSKLMNSLVN